MSILTLGVSFRRTPLELLERLAFSDDDLSKAYRHAEDADGVEGAVILSTCNRVEVYGSVVNYHAGFLSLKRLLVETRGVGADELADPLYAHWEQEAAEHLFAVASGLDSMVLGETQIYAQVREALRRARAAGAADTALTGLFHAASRAGRRARSETSLGSAPDAFVALGADLADEALVDGPGGLAGSDVVVVGAGQMAALSVKHVRRRGVGRVRILNRSVERARALADRTNAEAAGLDALPDAIRTADLVISATGATGTVIHASSILEAKADRGSRPLVLVDLAVPRDIDPAIAGEPGAHLIDIETLRDRFAEHDAQTAGDIDRARDIVADEVRRFVVRRRGDALAPLITALRRRGDEVVRGEFDRQAGRLADLTPDERAAVDALARGIAAKLLHDPIVGLKERSEPDTDAMYARILAELLGIDPDDP
jgi:glutamyl-tRNA reductase